MPSYNNNQPTKENAMTYMYTQVSTDTLTRNEILVGVEFLSQLVDNFFTQTEPFTYIRS